METYAVFEVGVRDPQNPWGYPRVKTFMAPIAVWRAETPEKACQAAAAATRKLTTYIAIPCTSWGIEMIEVEGASEFGLPASEEETPELSA